MEQLTFTFRGKNYQTEPLTVGRFIDLWKMRSALSMGTYGQLYRNAMESSDEALTMIDIEAFLAVFCPVFKSDLKPGTINELGLEDYLELKQVFVEHIQPWVVSVENLLKKKNE